MKRILIQLLLKKFNFNVKRIPGVSYDIENPEYKKYVSNGIEEYLTAMSSSRPNGPNGVIGCWIAHSKALECISDCDGITVVLEDDFICKANFFNQAMAMLHNFDKEFDIIFFDPRGTGPVSNQMISPNIYKPLRTSSPFYVGSQCLFINNKSISKILEIKLNSAIKDVDGFYLATDKIETYVFYTGQSTAMWLGSDTILENKFSILIIGLVKWFWYVIRK